MKIKRSVLKEIVRQAILQGGYKPQKQEPQREPGVLEPGEEEEQEQPFKKPNPLHPPKHAPKTNPKGVAENSEQDLIKKISTRYQKLQEDSKNSTKLIPLLLEITLEVLRKQWVESGKLDENTFESIVSTMGGRVSYVQWMVPLVAKGIIKEEDIYKWKDNISTFIQYQKSFKEKDILKYKTREDVSYLENRIIELERLKAKPTDTTNSVEEESYVSPVGIKELEEKGINYLGMVDGYQSFEVTKKAGTQEGFKVYSKYLGRCKDRSNKNRIRICTFNSLETLNSYLKQGSLYVFFKYSDPASPYQFHYETNQFMNKDDKSVL